MKRAPPLLLKVCVFCYDTLGCLSLLVLLIAAIYDAACSDSPAYALSKKEGEALVLAANSGLLLPIPQEFLPAAVTPNLSVVSPPPPSTSAALFTTSVSPAAPTSSTSLSIAPAPSAASSVSSPVDSVTPVTLTSKPSASLSHGNSNSSTVDSKQCESAAAAAAAAPAPAAVAVADPQHCNLRLATFYGPHMRPALMAHTFLDRVHRGLPLHVHGAGTQTRTYTHVRDVVSGILCVLRAAHAPPCVNISVRSSVSVLTAAQLAMVRQAKTAERHE
jgi:hypothetical protein